MGFGDTTDFPYRSSIGEYLSIVNIACASSASKYAVTIPSKFKKLIMKSTDGVTFTLTESSAGTTTFTVPANADPLVIDVAGVAGSTPFYVQFAANTKVLEVLCIG